jgi:hypothetical protein
MLSRSRFYPTVVVIFGLLLAVTNSSSGVDKKKPPPPPTEKKDPNETKDKPPIEADTLKPGSFRGLIVSVPNEGGLFRVAVEYKRVRIKLGKEGEYEKIQKDMVKQAAKAQGSQANAEAHLMLHPSHPGYWDRLDIANSVGNANNAATAYQGDAARLKDLLETVPDTQTVIFHAAPTVQVRVLTPTQRTLSSAPPDKKVDDPKKTTTPTPPEKKDVDDPKKPTTKVELPGYEGSLTDLKVGERVLVKLASVPAGSNSIYKRWVATVVVEEEAK